MSPFWEKFFYTLTFIFQGSSFLSPYAYGVMHRLHHAYADTEEDPHSPSFSASLFDMMWKTKNFNNILHREDQIQPNFRRCSSLGINGAIRGFLADSYWLGRTLCLVLHPICDGLVDVLAATDSLLDGTRTRSNHQLVRAQIRLYQLQSKRYGQKPTSV